MSSRDKLAIHTSDGTRLILKIRAIRVFDVLVNRKQKMPAQDAKETLSVASVTSQQPKQTKHHCRNAIKPKQKHMKAKYTSYKILKWSNDFTSHQIKLSIALHISNLLSLMSLNLCVPSRGCVKIKQVHKKKCILKLCPLLHQVEMKEP